MVEGYSPASNISVFDLLYDDTQAVFERTLAIGPIRVLYILYTTPCLLFSVVGSVLILLAAAKDRIKLNEASVALIIQVMIQLSWSIDSIYLYRIAS